MRKDILVKLVQHYDSIMSEALEKEENKELRKKLSDYFLDMLDSTLKGQVSNPDDLNKIENNAKKNNNSFIAFFTEEYAEDLLPIVTKIHDTLNKFPTIGSILIVVAALAFILFLVVLPKIFKNQSEFYDLLKKRFMTNNAVFVILAFPLFFLYRLYFNKKMKSIYHNKYISIIYVRKQRISNGIPYF